MHTYNAELARVVDGDTIDARIDLGFNVWIKRRIRLYGINTPESRTRDKAEKKRGLAAKKRLQEILVGNKRKFVLRSHGSGKYGRCLGEMFLTSIDENRSEVSINKMLVIEGHGVEYFGGKR
jgi:micrococcal nuclease